MVGQNFPVSEYYRENIIDAITINRTGPWWSAVLLIKDPKTDKPFLSFYKWQKKGDGWKTRQKFIVRRESDANKVISAVNKFSKKL